MVQTFNFKKMQVQSFQQLRHIDQDCVFF